MKKTLKLLAMAVMAGAAFAACGSDDDDNTNTNTGGGGNNQEPTGNYPPDAAVTEATQGTVKAGMAGAVEIKGSGFDPDVDMIFVGYEEGGETKFMEIPNNLVEIGRTRISIGVRIDAPYLDKTVDFYLDRIPYDKMPLAKGISFTLPTVEEGYIPDPVFRSFLSSDGHHTIGVHGCFTAYGLLDPARAATLESFGSKDGWTLDLASCQAESLEGIELFTGIKPREGDENVIVAAWDMPNVKKIDLSKWQLKKFEFRADRAVKLEEFIGSPYIHTIGLPGCKSIKKVDCSPCRALLRVWQGESGSALTELDLRRDQSGTYVENPTKEGEYCALQGDCSFAIADNGTVKIDSWFLGSHPVENAGKASCWVDIYNAWKKGATIEVYWWKDITRHLDTAPTYAEQPNALSPETMAEGETETKNEWKVEDPAE